jgi:predicted  nucleic acid-binding Zn-ribbon protein
VTSPLADQAGTSAGPSGSVGETLLTLQGLDTHLDQLRHRRIHLPERAELAEIQEQLAALDVRQGAVGERRDALAAEAERLELEVIDIEDKSAYADRVLYGGTVKALKELTALQDEIAAFTKRKSDLEDRALAIMEDIDGLEATLAERESERAVLDGRATALIAAIAEAEVAIDADLADSTARRADIAASLDPPVLANYESLRTNLAGIAVALLVGSRCQGCHLTLPAADLDHIRHLPVGEIARCPECDRLLVRH